MRCRPTPVLALVLGLALPTCAPLIAQDHDPRLHTNREQGRQLIKLPKEADAFGFVIFGDRTMHSDFLYQLEWLRYRKEGLLRRLTVAFSRDQAEKIYVQNRIAQEAKELYDWLEQGAHVYVCGEAENMAPAVHAALVNVVREIGGKSGDAAEAYVEAMKAAKRYQRDVY